MQLPAATAHHRHIQKDCQHLAGQHNIDKIDLRADDPYGRPQNPVEMQKVVICVVDLAAFTGERSCMLTKLSKGRRTPNLRILAGWFTRWEGVQVRLDRCCIQISWR